MRITRRTSIPPPSVGDATPLGGATSRSTGAARSDDSVDVSDTARTLQRLRAEIGDLETTATDTVRALQQRIDAGDYRPAPRAVAERLLTELASDLLA